jgi:hypothetical protein
MHGGVDPVSLEGFCQRTWVAAAGLFAVSQQDDDGGTLAVVKNLCGALDRGGDRRLPVGVDGVEFLHDALGGICRRRQAQVNVGAGAGGARPGAKHDEAEVARGSHFRKHFTQRFACRRDARCRFLAEAGTGHRS